MNDELKPEDMQYGLMAVDMREMQSKPDEPVVILHFCGYANPPTQEDVNLMYHTMATNKDFGVSDIMEHIAIYTAPQSIVEEYRNDLINGVANPVEPKSEP